MSKEAALVDVKQVVTCFGDTIKILNTDDEEVVKNEYGDIISRNAAEIVNTLAFPITYAPTDKELRQAGLTDSSDILVYLSTELLKEKNIGFKDLNHDHMELQVQEEQWIINQIARFSQYQNEWLYITVGGRRD